jgi:hypothetical protein
MFVVLDRSDKLIYKFRKVCVYVCVWCVCARAYVCGVCVCEESDGSLVNCV